MTVIATARLVLRPYRRGDEDDLVRAANDPRVAATVRDRFPHPYTRDDADEWLAIAQRIDPVRSLGITSDDHVIGGIGAEFGEDVNRLCAEIGYWLGVDHWGKGYATEALVAYCEHLFAMTPLERLFATVYDGNAASVRVLEKAGFDFEGTARRAVIKHGQILDLHVFARLRP